MRNHNKKLYVLSAIIFLGIVAIIFSNAPTSYEVVEPVQQVENVALAKKSAEINESGKKVPVELKELEPEQISTSGAMGQMPKNDWEKLRLKFHPKE